MTSTNQQANPLNTRKTLQKVLDDFTAAFDESGISLENLERAASTADLRRLAMYSSYDQAQQLRFRVLVNGSSRRVVAFFTFMTADWYLTGLSTHGGEWGIDELRKQYGSLPAVLEHCPETVEYDDEELERREQLLELLVEGLREGER